MNNFLIRSASAVVFVAVLIGSLFFDYHVFMLVLSILAGIALWEYARMIEHLEIKITRWPYVAAGILLCLSFINARENMHRLAFLLVLLVIVHVSLEVCTQKGNLKRLVYLLFGYLYAVIPFGMSTFVLRDAQGLYRPEMMLMMFAVIWTNDTFAYLVGMSIGKHKMCPRVSPKKSWEGFAGGMIGALIIAILISSVFHYYPLSKAIVICLSVAFAGVLGDLMESLIKRTVGVKDSGNLIPGHGGVLDRLDAALLAIPVMYVLM